MHKKYFYYLLSFIIPIVFLFIISTIAGYIPFGKYSFNVFDAFYQYAPIIQELSQKLKLGKSILFTLHGGMGVNFFSIFSVYAASPFNLLGVFFKREHIYIFFTLLIYIKLGLSGFFMYMYLNHLETKYKDTVWNLVFALIYALSGYITIYMMHVMWMDAYYLLPLVMLGFQNLIDKNKPMLYVLSLSLVMLINYYMAFMICIFLVIYFLYYTIIKDKFKKPFIKRFILYSLVSALIAMVILLPSAISLFRGRLEGLEVNNLLGIQKFTLFSLPFNFTIGSFIVNDNYNYGSNNIFCTLFVLVLVIYFFFNKKISKKEKIATGFVIAFFLVSFWVNLLDFAWNIFQPPVWWSHRYQFLFSFFLIIVAYNSLVNFDKINIRKLKSLIVIIFMMLVIGSLSYKLKGLHLEDTYIYLMFLSLGLFFIYMFFINIKPLFMFLVVLEVCINTYHNVTINRGKEYEKIVDEYQYKEELLNRVKDKEKWRSTFVIDNYEDEGLLHDFNSVELFSSSYNNKSLNFIDKVNVSNKDINHQRLFMYNPAVLSLLGVRYIIGDSNYYNCEDKICVNEWALPLGYEIPDTLLDVHLKDNYIDNINNIYTSLVGEEVNLFNELKDEDIELINLKYSLDRGVYDVGSNPQIKIKHKAEDREMVIFNDLNVVLTLEPTVLINNEEIEVINSNSDDVVVLEKGDEIEVLYNYDKNISFKYKDYFFSLLNLDKYEDSIKKIKDNCTWEGVVDDSKSELKGVITSRGGYVMLTIPYDEGLIIKVDGKKVKYREVLDSFVAFKVSNKKQVIEVYYWPRGLTEGIIISLISLGGFLYYEKKRKK